MQATAAQIKPIANFIYRSMQVGILLVAAGTFLGGWWADVSWGRFWGWDPKEVWALITLLVYLIPLHGRFAGWVNTFWLVMASVACFLSVLMAWYGVNFVLGVGLHSYGFTEGGSQGTVGIATLVVLSFAAGAFWRRHSRRRRPGDGLTGHLTPGRQDRQRARVEEDRSLGHPPSSTAILASRLVATCDPSPPEAVPWAIRHPLVLINAVGLTGRLLAMAPRLKALADRGWRRPLREVVPAVTCTAQASILTGLPPEGHGVVGNGWFFRDTGEVRFWQQSNALIQAEPLYVTARRRPAERGRPFKVGQAVLVVQPGGGGRPERHPQALLRGRRQQGVRDRRDARRPDRPARSRAGQVPVPHLLGPGRRPRLHPLDRPMPPPASSATSGPT